MSKKIEIVVDNIANGFKTILEANLVGVYLHGSLAMGCFNPETSDIDLLVIVKERIDEECKRRIVEYLVTVEKEYSKNDIEMSIVLEQLVRLGTHPMPFLLHYSKLHKINYLENGKLCEESIDPDLISHLAVIRSRGKCIYGKAIDKLGVCIEEVDFIDSILNDVDYDENDILDKPEYGILNLCRTLKYLEDHSFSSKLEGGEWALGKYGLKFDNVIRNMLCKYSGTGLIINMDNEDNLNVASTLLKEVKKKVDDIKML
jgi:streptomycin 3"-adenylyltransferase